MTSSPETTPTDTPLPACSSGRTPSHSPAHALQPSDSLRLCRLSDREHAPSPMESTQVWALPMCILFRDLHAAPLGIRTDGIFCSPLQEESSTAPSL